MKVRVFTLPWQQDGSGFRDEDVVAFLADHDAVDVTQHFFMHDKTPVLVLVVSYREPAAVSPRFVRTHGRPSAEDVAGELDPDDRRRFEARRTWRNQYARRTGKPPYVVFTNRQASALARRNPDSLSGLGEIEGMGPSRIEDFGAELLEVLRIVTLPDLGGATSSAGAVGPVMTES
ncbi:MAG: HRDC domain-containing protein [Candidatus Sericytochromatia bacterium]|nr:HRDC domain-containing protein [Candidatus Sericytochromatia bacterium]